MTDCIDGSDESDSTCEESEFVIKGNRGRLCSIVGVFLNNTNKQKKTNKQKNYYNNVLRLNFALS